MPVEHSTLLVGYLWQVSIARLFTNSKLFCLNGNVNDEEQRGELRRPLRCSPLADARPVHHAYLLASGAPESARLEHRTTINSSILTGVGDRNKPIECGRSNLRKSRDSRLPKKEVVLRISLRTLRWKAFGEESSALSANRQAAFGTRRAVHLILNLQVVSG